MPVNVVKTEKDESKWKSATEIAEKAGKGDNYAYIMGIYKKMKPDYKFKKTASQILIKPPPGEAQLVKELSQISSQRSKYVPNKSRDKALDSMSGLFSKLLGVPESEIRKEMLAIVPIIKAHKQHFNLDRPHQLAKRMGIPFDHDYNSVPSAHTKSYPSGHTTQAHYLALVYSRRYPKLKNKLMQLANRIESSRIDRGLHFPSDNRAGVELANTLFNIKYKGVKMTGKEKQAQAFRNEMANIVGSLEKGAMLGGIRSGLRRMGSSIERGVANTKNFVHSNAVDINKGINTFTNAAQYGGPGMLAAGMSEGLRLGGKGLAKVPGQSTLATNVRKGGKFVSDTSEALGEIGASAFKKGGVVKKPTLATLAEDGDPEVVIPLGNDKADIKNRNKVIKKALKVMRKHKEKTAQEKMDYKKVLPGVGGAVGFGVGASHPDLFNPKALFPQLKNIKSGRGRVLSGLLGAATMSGVGYLPSAVSDTVGELKKLRGSNVKRSQKKNLRV